MFTDKVRRILLFAAILIPVLLLDHYAPLLAQDTSEPEHYRIAIKGYDPVAYFTQDRALKGTSDYAYTWNGAQWHFSNPEHRSRFAQNPERYAPQFGGHCANGLSKGKLVAADPEQWTIVDGKLYMNYSRQSRDTWRQNQASMIEAAEKNWAGMQ